MKPLKSCSFGKACGDLPGICIVLQTLMVIFLAGALGYLFVTQEILK